MPVEIKLRSFYICKTVRAANVPKDTRRKVLHGFRFQPVHVLRPYGVSRPRRLRRREKGLKVAADHAHNAYGLDAGTCALREIPLCRRPPRRTDFDTSVDFSPTSLDSSCAPVGKRTNPRKLRTEKSFTPRRSRNPSMLTTSTSSTLDNGPETSGKHPRHGRIQLFA